MAVMPGPPSPSSNGGYVVEEQPRRTSRPTLPPHLQNLQTELPHHNPVNDDGSNIVRGDDEDGAGEVTRTNPSREEVLRRQYHESQTSVPLGQQEIALDGGGTCCQTIVELFMGCCACGFLCCSWSQKACCGAKAQSRAGYASAEREPLVRGRTRTRQVYQS